MSKPNKDTWKPTITFNLIVSFAINRDTIYDNDKLLSVIGKNPYTLDKLESYIELNIILIDYELDEDEYSTNSYGLVDNIYPSKDKLDFIKKISDIVKSKNIGIGSTMYDPECEHMAFEYFSDMISLDISK